MAMVLLGSTVNVMAGSLVEWRQALGDADGPRVLALWRNTAGQADRDEDGGTMLHRALQVYSGRRVEVVRALLAAGAPVSARVEDGATPLHWATAFGADDCVPLLLAARADVHARDEDGRTPLFSASPAAAVVLIAAGADPLARNRFGEVPLHRNRQAAFLAAGVDVRDNAGLTPLHHAALAGNDSAVSWLLEHGADPQARTVLDTHVRSMSMSKAFGAGELVPAGSRPYDLALAQYRRTRSNTGAHEAAMKRLDAVTPRNSLFSR
jgi:ankyrin repeat protein